MSLVSLKFQGVQTMVQNPAVGVIVLTDMEEKRQISVICDGYTRLQFAVRMRQIDPAQIQFRIQEDGEEGPMEEFLEESSLHEEQEKPQKEAKQKPLTEQKMLPEVLCSIIHYMTSLKLGVSIVNIYDGEYRAVILDYTSGTRFPIRVADGILLTIANRHVPLTIEEEVWKYQSVPYKRDGQGVAMPINTLTMPMLRKALQAAIDEERYEVAKALNEEIRKREL